jgi:hypothetical protein
MAERYEIVRCSPELWESAARLHASVFHAEVAEAREYLAWKHERNPYRTEPLAFVAVRSGEVVGLRGFLPTRWEAGTPCRTFDALYAGDFAVAPEHRDRGLVSRIMRTAWSRLSSEEPYRYAVNLSAGRITHLASLAGGWKSAGTVDPVARRSAMRSLLWRARDRLRQMPAVGELASRLAVRGSGAREPFRRLDRRPPRWPAPLTASRQPRSRDMADLVARLPYDGRIRHVRDERYLEWRFRNPMRSYRFLYWDEGRLEGYLVLQAGWRQGRVHIVDGEARDDAVRARLLRGAIEISGAPELVAWGATLGSEGRRLFEEKGFRPADVPITATGRPCVLVRPIRDEDLAGEWSVAGRRLLDPADWDLRMIVSMHG